MQPTTPEMAIQALDELYYASCGSLRKAAGSAAVYLSSNNKNPTLTQFLQDLHNPVYLNEIPYLGKQGAANLQAYFTRSPRKE